ncbi:MAG: tRNA (N6-threonylcarbamoyladenosine(37)-N6)-methyltransferase TrmO [Oscillospiraceae bacterium]|nr:tRNA (N6-threonylcarbamoyladenosine(37)-N6)-methyltransferase TrmO [Oscillospiraceae bacterium]
MNEFTIRPVAHIESDFGEKFGIPRQAGIVEELRARVVFDGEYRCDEALRGIEGFSRLWLIWGFSEAQREAWSPTVRPPRLGGNVRMGVFATRSPFRPNSLGLSCVRLLGVEKCEGKGTTLLVGGADLMDGTPIFDVKPYVPYADAYPEAASGFAPDPGKTLEVVFADALLEKVPEEKRAALRGVLANDPRPRYQDDPERVYAMSFASLTVRFRVEDKLLTVTEVESP